MLTPYDEFPVHQHAYPFSEVPSNEFNWDDGYYFGVYSAEQHAFVYTGLRVTPNSEVIAGYAGLNLGGVQTTVRASRLWREDYSVSAGPLRYEFLTPYREIRLVLEPNDSPLSFDITWQGISPAYLEAHHHAKRGPRVTTDQTRYGQGGTARGWIQLGDRRIEVTPGSWFADRDHSWGLYEPRAPLSEPERKWLPPAGQAGAKRMFRFWLPFQTLDYTGFYQFHEDQLGGQAMLNDAFGTPFEGQVDYPFDSGKPSVRFVQGKHDLEFEPGTRLMRGGTVDLVDEAGRSWHQEIEVAAPPWVTFPIGYYMGTWRDGGNIHTYHGSPYTEWDVIDFSSQPAGHQTYDGRVYQGLYGAEYVVRVRTTGPDGTVEGLGHIEFFMHRAYSRYASQTGPA